MRLFGAVMLTLGLGAAGLPAAAQGLCGGAGDAGQWIGGSEESSDIATAPAYLEQMALVLMGNEHVALFSVSAQTDVRIEAAPRGAGDPVIDLRNAEGEILLSDDDSGGGGAARMELPLAPGTYCVSMRSYDGGPMTGLVRVGQFAHETLTEGPGVVLPPDIPDDMATCDMAAAVPMAEGPIDEAMTDGVSVTASAADQPFLRFEILGEQMMTITAENEAADPRIVLFDEYGSWIGENDDHNGLNALIDMSTPLWPGSYCIAVSALTDPSLPITVTVKAYDMAAALLVKYDNAEAAPPLDGSYAVTDLGPLTGRLRADIPTGSTATWFSVDLDEAGLLLIEAVTNEAGDPVLTLFDDLGRKVGFNDDSNGTLDSMIAARVLPGTYLVAVRQVGDRSDVPTRMVFERYALSRP